MAEMMIYRNGDAILRDQCDRSTIMRLLGNAEIVGESRDGHVDHGASARHDFRPGFGSVLSLQVIALTICDTSFWVSWRAVAG
jgi:hypothetical protein